MNLIDWLSNRRKRTSEDKLKMAYEEIGQKMPEITTSTDLSSLCKDFRDITLEKRKVSAREKELKKQLETLGFILSMRMIQESVSNVTVENYIVFLKRLIIGNIHPQAKDSVFKRLEDIGEDWIITRSIHARILSSWIKQRRAENTEIPKGIEVITKIQVGVRKSTKRGGDD